MKITEMKLEELLKITPQDSYEGILDAKVVKKIFNLDQPIKDKSIRVDFLINNDIYDGKDREIAIVYRLNKPILIYQIVNYMEVTNVRVLDSSKLGFLYMNHIIKNKVNGINSINKESNYKIEGIKENIILNNNKFELE